MSSGVLKKNVSSQPAPAIVSPAPIVLCCPATGLKNNWDSGGRADAMSRRSAARYAVGKLDVDRIVIDGITRRFAPDPQMVCLGRICWKCQLEIVGGVGQRRRNGRCAKVGIPDRVASRRSGVCDYGPSPFPHRRL